MIAHPTARGACFAVLLSFAGAAPAPAQSMFGPPDPVPSGHHPLEVAAGDLNGDGTPDLAVACRGGGAHDELYVYLNDGAGGLGSPVAADAGADARDVELQDVDGDIDVVVLDCNPGGLRVYRNDGSGTLDAPIHFGLAEGVQRVAMADVDLEGDGHAELVAVAPGTIAIATVFSYEPATGWENEGDYPAGNNAGWGGIAAPDLDGDGFRELVVCGYQAEQLAVLQHAGTDCGVASHCVGYPDSVGPGGVMGWTGTPGLAQNQFFLRAGLLPPGQSALFFYADQALPAPAPFGDGVRCIGGGITRLDPALSTDATGNVVRQLDFGAPPASAFQVGETRHFQLWYRDPIPVGWGWNLTDALAVTFCP